VPDLGATLARQDVTLWDAAMVDEAEALLTRQPRCSPHMSSLAQRSISRPASPATWPYDTSCGNLRPRFVDNDVVNDRATSAPFTSL
jgi:hypothetical protein